MHTATPRTSSQLAEGFRLLAAVLERDGVPPRFIPDQGVTVDLLVTDMEAVLRFAEQHAVPVKTYDDYTWAELPLGEGLDMPENASSAPYAGAVVLAVTHSPKHEDN